MDDDLPGRLKAKTVVIVILDVTNRNETSRNAAITGSPHLLRKPEAGTAPVPVQGEPDHWWPFLTRVLTQLTVDPAS
jgi:hypothetical protein